MGKIVWPKNSQKLSRWIHWFQRSSFCKCLGQTIFPSTFFKKTDFSSQELAQGSLCNTQFRLYKNFNMSYSIQKMKSFAGTRLFWYNFWWPRRRTESLKLQRIFWSYAKTKKSRILNLAHFSKKKEKNVYLIEKGRVILLLELVFSAFYYLIRNKLWKLLQRTYFWYQSPNRLLHLARLCPDCLKAILSIKRLRSEMRPYSKTHIGHMWMFTLPVERRKKEIFLSYL